MVELYGVGDGDFANAPMVAETISIARLVDAGFGFKEQGFHRVFLEPQILSSDSSHIGRTGRCLRVVEGAGAAVPCPTRNNREGCGTEAPAATEIGERVSEM